MTGSRDTSDQSPSGQAGNGDDASGDGEPAGTDRRSLGTETDDAVPAGSTADGRSADETPDQTATRPAPRRRTEHEQDNGSVDEWKLLVRDVVTSVVAVVLVGAYLFAISGVFPPMVAIESGSMTPNMNVNDLVFVMDADRFPPEAAHGETGVVTAQTGTDVGYEQFNGHGDVIIFEPNGNGAGTPVIHRSMFWVNESEDWYDKANEEYVGAANSCAELSGCPADHGGFITKGDNNPRYDQAGPGRLSEPVKPEWIIGTAEVRIPGLGWVRLRV